MNLLGDLLGNNQQKQELQNFLGRFEQGQPSEGYSGQEALQRYQQVAPNLPAGEYQQAAEQMLSKLTPQQQIQLGQVLEQQAMQQGVQLPAAQTPREPSQASGALAQMLTQLHQQQPGVLGQLLGGGQRGNGGSMGQMLDNPVAKIALAGIAAYATKRALAKV
jgi:hypothetical protein